MTRPRGPDPADVIERTCRTNPGLDPALLVKKILADLKGHRLRIVADASKTITYCPHHPSVKQPCMLPHPQPDEPEHSDGY